jgi:glucose/arabinose dehydrogenase
VFARDGTLFVTQGERAITEGRMQARGRRAAGQIVASILRIRSRRTNPFTGPAARDRSGRSVIATSGGHAEPATGELWEVERGTRGGDEINIARKGKDYGWPTIASRIE